MRLTHRSSKPPQLDLACPCCVPRRKVLAGLAALSVSALAPSVPTLAQAPVAAPKSRRIDLHHHFTPPAYAEQRAGVIDPGPYSTIYRAAQTKQPAQTADITKLQAYLDGDPWLIATVSLASYRGVLSVPMMLPSTAVMGLPA